MDWADPIACADPSTLNEKHWAQTYKPTDPKAAGLSGSFCWLAIQTLHSVGKPSLKRSPKALGLEAKIPVRGGMRTVPALSTGCPTGECVCASRHNLNRLLCQQALGRPIAHLLLAARELRHALRLPRRISLNRHPPRQGVFNSQDNAKCAGPIFASGAVGFFEPWRSNRPKGA